VGDEGVVECAPVPLVGREVVEQVAVGAGDQGGDGLLYGLGDAAEVGAGDEVEQGLFAGGDPALAEFGGGAGRPAGRRRGGRSGRATAVAGCRDAAPHPGHPLVVRQHHDRRQPVLQVTPAARASAARVGPLPQLANRYERDAPGLVGQTGEQRAGEPVSHDLGGDVRIEYDEIHRLRQIGVPGSRHVRQELVQFLVRLEDVRPGMSCTDRTGPTPCRRADSSSDTSSPAPVDRDVRWLRGCGSGGTGRATSWHRVGPAPGLAPQSPALALSLSVSARRKPPGCRTGGGPARSASATTVGVGSAAGVCRSADAEVGLLHPGVGEQFAGPAGERDPAGLQHVGVLGRVQGGVDVLLDE
jgi:hypothetical protein